MKYLACVKYARLVSLHDKSSSVVQTVSKFPEKVVDWQGAMNIMVSKMNRDELEKIDKLFYITYLIGKYNKQCSFIQIHIWNWL